MLCEKVIKGFVCEVGWGGGVLIFWGSGYCREVGIDLLYE